MIELAAAATIAKLVSDAVGALDKMFRGYADFAKSRAPDAVNAPPPDFAYVNSPDQKAMVAKSRRSGEVYQLVTYDELSKKLTKEDREHVEALNRAMQTYQKQWNALYEQRAVAGLGLATVQIDAQLDYLAKQVSDPLIRVLSFVEKMGLYLDDHYHVARMIAEEYLRNTEGADAQTDPDG